MIITLQAPTMTATTGGTVSLSVDARGIVMTVTDGKRDGAVIVLTFGTVLSRMLVDRLKVCAAEWRSISK